MSSRGGSLSTIAVAIDYCLQLFSLSQAILNLCIPIASLYGDNILLGLRVFTFAFTKIRHDLFTHSGVEFEYEFWYEFDILCDILQSW